MSIRGRKNFYFGRNMDIYREYSFETAKIHGENGFMFSCEESLRTCHSTLGTAVTVNGYPLYADAMNDRGLCMAGLDFPEYAFYSDTESKEKHNVAPYEMIPWILTQCASVSEAELLLKDTNVINRPFAPSLPLTPLHWMLADRERSLVIEPREEGLKLYSCASNVLTNAPEYPFHAVNLRQFASFTAEPPEIGEYEKRIGKPFSYGFGGIGLPGDYSSASRFIKAAFSSECASSIIDEANDGVPELLRALLTVAVPRGSVRTEDGACNMTVYTSCMDTANGKYYRLPYSLTAPLECEELHMVER